MQQSHQLQSKVDIEGIEAGIGKIVSRGIVQGKGVGEVEVRAVWKAQLK